MIFQRKKKRQLSSDQLEYSSVKVLGNDRVVCLRTNWTSTNILNHKSILKIFTIYSLENHSLKMLHSQ